MRRLERSLTAREAPIAFCLHTTSLPREGGVVWREKERAGVGVSQVTKFGVDSCYLEPPGISLGTSPMQARNSSTSNFHTSPPTNE